MFVTNPRSTSGRGNFQLISRLVIIGGKTLVRKIFDIRCPPNHLYKMLQNPSIVERLEGAKLTKPEWNCLYPSPGVCGKSADFDITLLLKLLSTICNLTPPATGWVARPTYEDHSLAADLVRIKFYRNLLGHSNQSMTYDEFLSLSEEISSSLLRIAAEIGPEKETEWQKIIHKLLKDPLIVQEGKNAEELLQWYENDTEAMKQFVPVLTTSTEPFSLETTPRELGQRIRKLLRKDLIAKTRGVQEVQPSSLKGVEEGVEETTHIAEAAAREIFQIKDQQGEVHQPTACIRLYIDYEVMSGPDVRGRSSEKDLVKQEPQEDAGLKGTTHVTESEVRVEAQDVKGELVPELKTITQEAQIGAERMGLKGVQEGQEGITHLTESAASKEAHDIKSHQDEEPRLKLEIRLGSEDKELGIRGESSKELQGEDQGARGKPNIPTEAEVLRLIALNYLRSKQPSSKEDCDSFLEYMKKIRVVITGVEVGSVILSLEFTSLEILDRLWVEYNTGQMNEMAQKFLIKEFGEVKLTTTILEEEYEACRAYFLQFSVTLPPEIRVRGPEASRAFRKAMSSGTVQVYRGRIMIIGQDRAGKTSLKKSLLGIPFNPQEDSTEGIEVDLSKLEIDVDRVKNWRRTEQKGLDVHDFHDDIAMSIAADLRDQDSLSEQNREPTEQKDLDVHENTAKDLVDQNSLSDQEHKKLTPDANKKKTTEASLPTGNSAEGSKPLDLDIETTEVFPTDLMERVAHYLKTLKLDEEIKDKEYMIDMWDFAGQHLYYASHAAFLSSRALYILVCNLSKGLDAVAEPCVRQGINKKLKNPNKETNLENLLSWLVSVHRLRPEANDVVHRSNGQQWYVRPPVIIVGTNADHPAVGDAKEMLECILESVPEKGLLEHVISHFCVDNTGSLPDDREALKEKILEVLKMEPYMGEKRPIRWFHFEKIVQALVENKIYHVKLEELRTLVKKVCKIDDEEEMMLMLNFYHDLGQIVEHRNTVVLKTQWLIDLFKKVITVPKKPDTIVTKYWKELQNRGVLSMDLIDHVFHEHIHEGLDKDDILDLMEQYGLIAIFLPNSKTKPPKYFVPAQLTSPPPELCKKEPSGSDPCSLYVTFPDGFVPHGLFPQLLTRCIAWCCKRDFREEPVLYDCGARFFIGKKPIYILVLICRKRSIKVVLTKIDAASGSSHTASKELEPWEVRAVLDDTLAGLSELPWLRNLRYDWCVLCTGCKCDKHDSVGCPCEECLHLKEVDFSETKIFCTKSLKDETIQVPGLDKWLPVSKGSETEGQSKANQFSTTDQTNASVGKERKREKRKKKRKQENEKEREKMSSRSATRVDQSDASEVDQSTNRKRKVSCSSTQDSKKIKTKAGDGVAFKEGEPSDRELNELAGKIGAKWDTLGIHLGITQNVLDGIGANEKDKPYRMLLHWNNTSTTLTPYKDLYQALCHPKVGLNKVAKEFCCK